MPTRNNLSKVLKNKGVSLEDLATNLDIPLNQIDELTEIYLGRRDFPPEILRKVALYLEVKEEELLSSRRRNMYQNIGIQLRQIREEKDFTLVELGKLSGVSYTHISEIERGKTCPSLKTLEKLARVLDISTSYFLQSETTLSLGEKIRRLREKQQYTQTQLAEKVGVSLSLIGQIETGRANPALDTLHKIANTFGVSICYFLLSDGEDKFIKVSGSNNPIDKLYELAQDLSASDINLLIEMIKLLRNSHKIGLNLSPNDGFLVEITDIMENLSEEDKKFVVDNARWILNKSQTKKNQSEIDNS